MTGTHTRDEKADALRKLAALIDASSIRAQRRADLTAKG